MRINSNFVRGYVLFLVTIFVFFSCVAYTNVAHAGFLTLPIDDIGDSDVHITSWFDHSATSSEMLRYTGISYYGIETSKDYCDEYNNGYGCYDDHHGIDYGTATTGKEVVAAATGKVGRAKWQNPDPSIGYGFHVALWHGTTSNCTVYAHMASTSMVSINDIVNVAEQIGIASSTGESDGPHLHFGVYDGTDSTECVSLDPAKQIDPYGWSGTTTDPWTVNQGYLWTTNPPSNYQPTVAETGTISSNETWEEGNIYYLSGAVTIASGVTVTVEPGTIIKFGTTGKLTVNGTLDAEGTETQPIYFTSYKDDTVGGDTNGDGSATTPAPGNWYEIVVGTGGSATLDHTVVRYGGNVMYSNMLFNDGILSISNSELASSSKPAINQTHSYATTTIASTTIHNVGYGFTATNGFLSITNSTFHDNATAAGSLRYDSGLRFTSSGNTATPGTGSVAGFSVYSAGITQDQVWTKGIPYILSGTVTIPAGKTLTLEPGTIVKSTNGTLSVSGTVDAEGTVDDLIYFTSYKDDVGGDTNGNGSATTPSAGDWRYISVNSGGNATLERVVARYGGYFGAIINNTGGTATIVNTMITDGYQYGIQTSAGVTTIASSTIADMATYGLYRYNSGSMDVSYSNIFDNGTYGAYSAYNTTLTAENNYWGDASGPYNSSLNPSGTGDPVSLYVGFYPWLSTEVSW